MNHVRQIHPTLDQVAAAPQPATARTPTLEVLTSLGTAALIPLAVFFQADFVQQRDNRMGIATTIAAMRPALVAVAPTLWQEDSTIHAPRVSSVVAPRLALASVVNSLRGPDGIAVDPLYGRVYITEEDAGRIVCVEGSNSAVVVDRDTPIYTERTGRKERAAPLRSPEGVALRPDGTLYVAEDVPGGRLLQFAVDPDGEATWGRDVPLPFGGHDFAWESVSVGPQGELLLAGSTAEHMLRGDAPGLFEGILLYRDEEGAWWDAHRRPMVSFSAAALSEDGQVAAYACEITGEIGWLDLSQRTLRSAASAHRFASPEGLCILPDGTLLIAEEAGRLWHLDPATDQAEMVQQALGAIESVAWCPVNEEVLVTSDEHGDLLRFRTESSALARPAPFRGRFEAEDVAGYPLIPESCPIYLTEVLKLAGYDPENCEDESFAELAARLSILAVDARATLLNGPAEDGNEVDPIVHVQFVIFHPGLMGLDFPGLVAPVSGFAVQHRSGKVVKTVLEERQFLHADFMTAAIQALGAGKVSIPYAGPAAVLNGAAFASFLGLGRTPDFCFNIDPHRREESRMTVLHADGGVHHYQLDLIPSEQNREWVVAMSPKAAAPWRQLSGPQRLVAMHVTGAPQLASATPAASVLL